MGVVVAVPDRRQLDLPPRSLVSLGPLASVVPSGGAERPRRRRFVRLLMGWPNSWRGHCNGDRREQTVAAEFVYQPPRQDGPPWYGRECVASTP
jgi:hypothetical protein